MSEVDELWNLAVERRDERLFGKWMGRVERPIRLSLRSWATRVDTEGVVQEALLRMWVLCCDHGAGPLTGENASLRYACGIAFNVARNEARKNGRLLPKDPIEMPETAVHDEPPIAPSFERAVRECVAALTGKLRDALQARLESDGRSDDTWLAEGLRMQKNTFLQNIVRARRKVAECLTGKGIVIEGGLK